MKPDKNRKVVLAKAEALPGDVPTILMGVPADAWDHMKNVKTHTFDLTKVGIPVKILMFGGADYASVIDLMDVVARTATGSPMEGRETALGDLPDLGIDEPTKQ